MREDDRRRQSRVPLSRDLIVDTAISLARREGLAGVSMRRVGRALGVEPMSLYYHVPSKATLMVLMADRSIADLPPADSSSPWQERLTDLLIHTLRAGIDNPALYPVLATEAADPDKVAAMGDDQVPASLMLFTKVQDLLQEARLPAEDQKHAYVGLIGLVVGLIAVHVDGLLPGAASQPGQTAGVGNGRPISSDPARTLRFHLRAFIHGLQSVPLENSGVNG